VNNFLGGNLRWLNTVSLGGQWYRATRGGFKKIKTNMAAKSAAKISFSCSRQLLKCSFCFSFIPKTGKLTSSEQFCSGIG